MTSSHTVILVLFSVLTLRSEPWTLPEALRFARTNAPDARIVFTSERFNDPGYAQLRRETDHRVRELGPDDDAMGAFGFQLEAHKWTNLQVRLREFMPVGVRPLPVPVT